MTNNNKKFLIALLKLIGIITLIVLGCLADNIF
jgi:hypothetical protein